MDQDPTGSDPGSSDVSAMDLRALGLPSQAADVLACLGGEGWTTSVALAAQLEVSRAVICRAVDVLVEAGLVERSRGRRPAPLRIHPAIDRVLAERLHGLATRRADDAERAERAAAWVREAALTAAQRPTPVHELDPAGAPDGLLLRTCKETYDEVARPTSMSVLFLGDMRRLRAARRRILVSGTPAVDRGRGLLHLGVELRTTEQALPLLLVADGVRARVEVSVDGRGGRTAWTHDALQVAALRRLFALWWAEGDPWRDPGS